PPAGGDRDARAAQVVPVAQGRGRGRPRGRPRRRGRRDLRLPRPQRRRQESTTLRMLATLVQPDGGSARIAGLDLRRAPDAVRRLRDAGMTVFLTTHYLDEADALCDRICIMDHGTIVAERWTRCGRCSTANPATRTWSGRW